ncbi:4'-phosphopantetheinyl transferase superfamily protein [Pseudoduganella sp. SL102]|uniref:4'-phosphopantetheinyl transferase family protein n=1 Tax=Pseudoduganella sp. SL102 TaxID=2995154 RepID=UPI00248B784B|nr:4'-phosphopantetheinyl transferase superfamily protein [Pseudoduganella sp. SL102]WBS04077.1 4'-phosphopantetheinyl transferase superfamily protein [Pseudoduganella sp. SL102]
MHDAHLQLLPLAPPLQQPLPVDPRDLPARNAVAVYLMELELPADATRTNMYLPLLALGELARWQAIRPRERQWQYLQSRVLQRVVLGAYIDDDPRALAFTRDRWGRPCLAEHEGLHFSLAQCASHVALAIGSDPVLGMEVATVAPLRRGFMRIAHRLFHQDDLAQLLECPEERRHARFLELWTLKEAYRKALGAGMPRPLAACGFGRTPEGVIVARDRAPLPDRPAPDAFIAQRRMRDCQIAVAYRRGRPVRFRYLHGSAALPWPETAADT